ncbi:accessory gland protein Acp53Ea [Drosophila subobscura]|uniref:accessory gland protein Acp53Ea n=1 Tax=Drosophila subobscura TaxID=7241 RepID=UPI00155AC56C|nr:accessory gland protein Acp53Ea [Drosophila subobscura]
MKSIQIICVVCSVMLLASVNRANAGEGLDIKKMGKCLDLGVKMASAMGQKIVPTIKTLATCAQFTPLKTKGLDSAAVLLLAYQFLQRIVRNQNCVLSTIQDTKNLLTPFAQTITELQCLNN